MTVCKAFVPAECYSFFLLADIFVLQNVIYLHDELIIAKSCFDRSDLQLWDFFKINLVSMICRRE